MAIEQTLVIIKPMNEHLGVFNLAISGYQKRGLKISRIADIKLSVHQAGELYRDHRAKPFFPDLCYQMSRSPVLIMVVEGEDAVRQVKEANGAANPLEADPNSVRGKLKRFFKGFPNNFVHSSDSPESAQREIEFILSLLPSPGSHTRL